MNFCIDICSHQGHFCTIILKPNPSVSFQSFQSLTTISDNFIPIHCHSGDMFQVPKKGNLHAPEMTNYIHFIHQAKIPQIKWGHVLFFPQTNRPLVWAKWVYITKKVFGGISCIKNVDSWQWVWKYLIFFSFTRKSIVTSRSRHRYFFRLTCGSKCN